jgi:2-methylcitrate dehydratase PrpD
LEAVERLVVRGNPLLAARADRPSVNTGREAQVCVQHSVAVALIFGQAGLSEYTDACVRDPVVRMVRAKITVERDETIDVAGASLHAHLKDGTTRVIDVAAARGSLARPLTDREIEDKLRVLASGHIALARVQPIIDAVWSLDRAPDAGAVVRLAAAAE